jgi:hypothetical protein
LCFLDRYTGANAVDRNFVWQIVGLIILN